MTSLPLSLRLVCPSTLAVLSLLIAATLQPTQVQAQASCNSSGSDRTIIGTVNANSYYPSPLATVNIAAGATSLPVDGAALRGTTAIAAGDLVLVVQVQGAPIDTRNQGTVGGQYGDGPGGDDRMGVINNATFVAAATNGISRTDRLQVARCLCAFPHPTSIQARSPSPRWGPIRRLAFGVTRWCGSLCFVI